MPSRPGRRVRARGQADPGTALARADRHPVPPRQARRPDRYASGAGPAHHRTLPALDTLFLAAPVANKGSLTQYVGRILRSHENKTTAEVHDYLDERTGVLAAMLAKRAPGLL